MTRKEEFNALLTEVLNEIYPGAKLDYAVPHMSGKITGQFVDSDDESLVFDFEIENGQIDYKPISQR